MRKINGYTVFAILPVLKNDGNIVDGYVIAGEREITAGGETIHETVTAWVSTLDSTDWRHGHYLHSPRPGEIRSRALHDAMFRASLAPTPVRETV